MGNGAVTEQAVNFHSENWAHIAQQPLEVIKDYLLTGYLHGAPYVDDSLDEFFEHRRKLGSILDFGCGIGRNFAQLSRRCRQLVGYDIAPMVQTCSRCVDGVFDNLVLLDDWQAVRRRKFDLVVAHFAFQHLEQVDTLRFFLRELSRITDYLLVKGRSWMDTPDKDNVLSVILEENGFSRVKGSPQDAQAVLRAPAGGDMHFHYLFRTRNPALWRRRNASVFAEAGSDVVAFPDFTVCLDAGAMKDPRGIGRVNRELRAEFRRRHTAIDDAATSASRGPEVRFYGSVHWCPATLPARSVVLVHDVIPLIFPGRFPTAARDWVDTYQPIARQAARIVAISDSGAEDIVRHLAIPFSRIRVVGNGVRRLPVARNGTWSASGRPYLVVVGADDYHKNLGLLLRVMSRHDMSGFDLVVVGSVDRIRQRANNSHACRNVRFVGRIADRELGALLRGAVALLHPSLYEGFGLPPLEAALLGVPSICGDRPALNTILRGGALFVDPDDPQAWARAIHGMTDEQARRKLAAAAREIARRYTWEASVDRLTTVFGEVAGVAEADLAKPHCRFRLETADRLLGTSLAEEFVALWSRHFPARPLQATDLACMPFVVDPAIHLYRFKRDPDARVGNVVLSQLEAREVVHRLLEVMATYFERHGIRYWLEWGTLAGSCLFGDFIPWDDDIDVAVLKEDWSRVEAFQGYVEQHQSREFIVNFDPRYRTSVDGRLIHLETGIYIDLCVYEAFADVVAKCSIDEDGYAGGTRYPVEWILPLSRARFGSRSYHVPNQVRKVLFDDPRPHTRLPDSRGPGYGTDKPHVSEADWLYYFRNFVFVRLRNALRTRRYVTVDAPPQDDAALLERRLQQENPFGLQLLQSTCDGTRTVGEVVERLQEDFPGQDTTVEVEVLSLLADGIDSGLFRPVDAPLEQRGAAS